MSSGSSQPRDSSPIIIDGISYIPSSALLTGISKVSLKDNYAFAVVDPLGESPRLYWPSSELGVYFKDTRYLGIWEMTFNGISLVPLASELRFGGSSAVFSMTNRDVQEIDGSGRIRRDTFLIRRILTLFEDSLFETLEIKSFAAIPHRLQLDQWIGGRFDDVFEVRGFTRAKRGQALTPEVLEDRGQKISVLRYLGLDGVVRRTFIRRFFDVKELEISPVLMGYRTEVEVPPRETVLLKTIASFDQLATENLLGQSYGEMSVAEKMGVLSTCNSHFSSCSDLRIESDNAIVNRAIENAKTDISMLLTREISSALYPYAGVPWFSAPFGRDGLITAYQLLPWYPSIASGVLDYAFAILGKSVDPFTDEQPGKVFHEMRGGEMAATREVPFIPYYGSVDATPLALILLHEYVRWTWDRKSLEKWWPFALQALEWINRWGDSDGDGFLEYAKQSPTGLVNQGWKDSHDSIMHADGRLANPPIRLCEVQGYVFRAKMGMSALARFLGKSDLAAQLRKEALELKFLFRERFWDSQGQFFYLALEGENSAPCAVRSSNMGHCLWSQIASPEQASEVVKNLMSDSMFSGHGIRTLDRQEVAYNPLSYHNGSVWPHDNSIIMEGFRFYGYVQPLERLTMALIGVLESSDDFRLPELFCGFRKRGTEAPIPYEVACKPQAWAAGSVFLMLKAMLGLSLDLDQSYLVLNSPLVTSKINILEIKNLAVRNLEVDLLVRRTSTGTTLQVTRKTGNIKVLTVR